VNTVARGLGIALLGGVTLAAHPTDEPAAAGEVARLSLLYPLPWVISYRVMAGLTIFTARRPGLTLNHGSAGALEDELQLWEQAPRASESCPERTRSRS
jgi:hypothetical protein